MWKEIALVTVEYHTTPARDEVGVYWQSNQPMTSVSIKPCLNGFQKSTLLGELLSDTHNPWFIGLLIAVADTIRGERTENMVSFVSVWRCSAGWSEVPGEMSEWESDCDLLGWIHPETMEFTKL